MLSGSGRTLRNLVEAILGGRLRARIELVIASRESAGAQWAREAGLTTLIIPGEIPAPKLDRVLKEHRIEWVVLAGYLKLLNIPEAYRGRVVNIHPALLPAFGGPGMYGPRVHDAVIRAGATVSGCTVHLCDEGYDTGRIVLQKMCEVLPGDTPEMLAARVFELECEAYPEALARLIGGGERQP
jgi:phosphoribosylglycinamide formyltransferase 1